MDSDLAQEAIDAALDENWDKAIKLNSTILKEDPVNIDAMNRLAKAEAETGNLKRAKIITKKVLRLDPTDIIAAKCSQRWDNFKKNNIKTNSSRGIAKIFIEEPTRTKIVNLINLGDAENILTLDCGDTLKLVTHPHRVSIMTQDDKYIGRFPDNLAIKFISLIKLGGSFQVVVKSANKQEVKVLVHSDVKNVS